MTREIKFRGKRIGGDEWVFGDLLHDRDMHPHIVPQNQGFDIDDDMCEVYAVDPDTVGQYTGLKDKNGQEVYEGDIVVNREYHNEAWRLFTAEETLELDIADIMGELKKEEIGCIITQYASMYFEEQDGCYIDIAAMGGEQRFSHPIYELEVIGNIHDNPELLKGGEQ
ncbi:MAG: hypothetical protein K2G93_03900 [Rikenella sp.]|nr:hypothetical protein [Rikenella sp.]